jgi:hypothetical protein
MANLFQIERPGELIKASEKPFTDELQEMEPLVKANSQILGGWFVFGEQVFTSERDRRVDLLGINRDGEIAVIELKKDPVGIEILPQVLTYRVWWKARPDAAKSLWAECKNRPENLEPNWSSYDPKVIVVAPSFEEDLPRIIASEGLRISLVELTRYEHSGTTFVLVDEVSRDWVPQSLVAAQQDYDWPWYEENVFFTEEEARWAKAIVEKLKDLFARRGWSYSLKFAKWYIAFKRGANRVVWVEAYHKGKVAIAIGPRPSKAQPPPVGKYRWSWQKNLSYWFIEVEIDSPDFKVDDLLSALEESIRT